MTARLRKARAGVAGFSAVAVACYLCACKTAPSRLPAPTKTDKAGSDPAASTSSENHTNDPIDNTRGRHASAPWFLLKSIDFFPSRADLPAWETIKITEIATYFAQHPGSELGINQPVAPEGNLDAIDLNLRRVRTIINRLVEAGVSENEISVGWFGASTDGQVNVLVRSNHSSTALLSKP